MDIGADCARPLSAAGRAWPAGLCASMAQIHDPPISRFPSAILVVADLIG
jgi:hypothetical protein